MSLNHTQKLIAASRASDRAERTLGLAAVLSEALRAAGCYPVLVGGGAVEIYTRSAYTTRDLDFVAAISPGLEAAMLEMGFEQSGRHWLHRELGIVVEFPGTVLDPARSETIDVDGATLEIISVEDLVVDRLAGWKHWGWDPDGAAAVLLMALHRDLDSDRLRSRARVEDVNDALAALQPLADSGEPLEQETLRRLRADLSGESER